MRTYIVIDGGTTTTRVGLAADGEVLDTVKISVGARANMQSPGVLAAAVREAIDTLLCRHKVSPECIIAAGMITSEHGLYNLPHITAPAGTDELHDNIQQVSLPEISSLPFYFIPGVKTVGTLEESDMMRGEECEIFGLGDENFDDAVYVLPGSHSKVIRINGGKIQNFCTLLTGEMAASLREGTILRDAVDFSAECEQSYLLDGYRYCRDKGINEALFKVRILKNLLSASPDEVYSFYLGAVLEGEIKSILACAENKVVIAGKRQLREATAAILRSESDKTIITADDKTVNNSTFLGMIKIFENKKSSI